MSWKEYRETRDENYDTFTLVGVGLPDFWVKIRKVGSYTSNELAVAQRKWVDARIRFVMGRARDRIQATDPDGDSLYQEVEEAINFLEGGVSREDAQSETQQKLLNYFMEESALAKMQPLVGVDIELIHAWNLTDPDTERRLPIPKEDLSVLLQIPVSVLWHIKEKLLESQESVIPPKVRGMLSMSL